MRDARYEPQILSALDPFARANLLRYVTAYTQLLTGRPGVDALASEPPAGAGFRLDGGEERLSGALTRADGVERIYIAFDIDDAHAPLYSPN